MASSCAFTHSRFVAAVHVHDFFVGLRHIVNMHLHTLAFHPTVDHSGVDFVVTPLLVSSTHLVLLLLLHSNRACTARSRCYAVRRRRRYFVASALLQLCRFRTDLLSSSTHAAARAAGPTTYFNNRCYFTAVQHSQSPPLLGSQWPISALPPSPLKRQETTRRQRTSWHPVPA